ncbi:hypothetical protein MIS46_11195 [Wielerella bovis]|uniref:hypothetical protein n=1 Tax=Wielerella bovis TaxID=2917790 RepID=UPI002019C6D3|nr:hypothetical protein [Wielerella bovis]ULJ62487.1 hypothetical protein MIS46_11195 [Wielerella bovis]
MSKRYTKHRTKRHTKSKHHSIYPVVIRALILLSLGVCYLKANEDKVAAYLAGKFDEQTQIDNIMNELQEQKEQRERTKSESQKKVINEKAVYRSPDFFGLDNFLVKPLPIAAQVNPNNHVPEQGFDVYFIDKNQPEKVVHQENVAQIDLHSQSDLHGILGSNLKTYWIGKIRIPVDGTYRLSTSRTGDLLITLNKHRIYNNNQSGGTPTEMLQLAAGEYILELEFSSRVPVEQLDLFSQIQPVKGEIKEDIGDKLAMLSTGRTPFLYSVLVNGSTQANRRIDVNLPYATQPYILVLENRDTVIWQLHGGSSPLAILTESNGFIAANDKVNAIPQFVVARMGSPVSLSSPSSYVFYDAAHCRCTNFFADKKSRYVCPDDKKAQELSAEWARFAMQTYRINLAGFNVHKEEQQIDVPYYSVENQIAQLTPQAELLRRIASQQCSAEE